jgi:hypothetical protein
LYFSRSGSDVEFATAQPAPGDAREGDDQFGEMETWRGGDRGGKVAGEGEGHDEGSPGPQDDELAGMPFGDAHGGFGPCRVVDGHRSYGIWPCFCGCG